MPTPRTAVHDPALHARIVRRTPLRYAAGADDALDRPAHVRAASGLARVPGGLALVQDDALFVAIVDPALGAVRAIALPASADGRRLFDARRGNKADKLDLEACVALPDGDDTLLVAFGSGSTPTRERVVLVRGWNEAEPVVRVVHVPRLYGALRAARAFAGSELNVEGALLLGGRLRLFGRGNGAAREDPTASGTTLHPVDATCDLDWSMLRAHLDDPMGREPPAVTDVVPYALGAIDGARLTFTDAAATRHGVLYTAAAEDSPDVTRDGRVTGSAIGVIDAEGRTRWTPLLATTGQRFTGKAEGLQPVDAEATRLWVVVDVDDPDVPSDLYEVELRGQWS